jgi:ABC-2 type transport system permease protein
MAVFGIVFLMMLASVNFDLFGYESYVPAQIGVKEMHVTNLAGDNYMIQGDNNIRGITNPENIERVRLLHQRIIDREDENRNLQRSFNREFKTSQAAPGFNQRRVVSLGLTYIMKNGSRVKRVYSIDINSYRQYLYPIFDTEEARRSIYNRFFQIDVDKLDQINVNNFRLGKNIRIYKPAEIDEAFEALNKDMLNISYEEAVEGKVPAKAHVSFASKVNSNRGYSSYDLAFFADFKNFDAFLIRYGYNDELFLKPEEVSQISLRKAGSSTVKVVEDKQKIQVLLDWCTRSDKQAFLDKQAYMVKEPSSPNNPAVEYFGEILLKKGDPIWVGFDGSPYAWEQIKNIVTQ